MVSEVDEDGDEGGKDKVPPASKNLERDKPMSGERVLSDGLLSKTATYRVIVSGEIGPKEIDRLIAKLQLDRDILADSEDSDSDATS